MWEQVFRTNSDLCDLEEAGQIIPCLRISDLRLPPGMSCRFVLVFSSSLAPFSISILASWLSVPGPCLTGVSCLQFVNHRIGQPHQLFLTPGI